MNTRHAFWAALLIAAVACAAPARAGIYSDELAKCLVASTTQGDKTELVRWIFGVATLHPDVASISSITSNQRTEMSRNTGALVERLLTKSCRSQTIDALKYEGAIAMQLSFQVLGRVAMSALMTDPAVAAGMGEFVQFMDKSKLDDLAPNHSVR